MQDNSNFKPEANVLIQLFDEFGNLKDERHIHNTVTTVGKENLIDQILLSPSTSKITHMELGTGTGGTSKLNAYVSGSRTAFDSKTRSGAVVTIVTAFPAGVGTGTITEAGTFDTATQDSGNMWMYSSFTGIIKTSVDSLTITWTLTAS